MCGKNNPTDIQVCQFCQARLTPLRLGLEPDASLSDDAKPDWLQKLGDEPQSGDISTDGTANDPGILPDQGGDWLERIQIPGLEKASEMPIGMPAETSPTSGESVPDWVKGLKQDEPAPAPKPAPAVAPPTPIKTNATSLPETKPAVDDSDWLSSMRSLEDSQERKNLWEPIQHVPMDKVETVGDKDAAAAFCLGETDVNETDAWMKSLNDWKPITPPADEQRPIAAKTPRGIPPRPGLSGQPIATPPVPPRVVPPEPVGPVEVPDWLNNLGESVPEESITEEDPEWLRAIQPPATDKPAPVEENAESADPEWMRNIQVQPRSDTPEWMRDLKPVESVELDQPDSSVLDLPEIQPDTELNSPQTPLTSSTSFIPEPLAGEDAAAGAVTPGWLGEMTQAGHPPAAPGGNATDDISGMEANPFKGSGQAPEWLQNIAAPGQPGWADETASSLPFGGEDVSQWIQQPTPDTPEFAAPATPAFNFDAGMETPDLTVHPFADQQQMPVFDEASGDENGAENAIRVSEVASESLEPAQLPPWLAAMRPVEAVAPGLSAHIDDQRIEKSGPLSGLRGILPGEELTSTYRKPPTYSAKLHISERQRAQSELLMAMVAEENNPMPLRAETVQGPRRLVRMVVGILVIAVVLFGMYTGSTATTMRGLNLPVEVINFHNQINTLPENAAVLMAFDYEPGFAGEMRFAGRGVVESLIIKKARLISISTQPSGPILAVEMVGSAIQALPVLDPQNQPLSVDNFLTNLGYLPGGMTGLGAFASNPRQAVPYGLNSAIDRVSTWERSGEMLADIRSLSDFAMLVVFTDDVDTARAWVEQAGPRLNGKPLLLVTSAQAAPMVSPYVASGQVSGLIAGMGSGLAYEKLADLPLTSPSSWTAYQYSLAAAAVFVLVGILLRMVALIFPARKSKKEA
jgi:hypothetical protein